MGVRVTVKIAAESQAAAESAARGVFDEFARIENIASDYRPQSEVNRLCRTGVNKWVKVSPELYQLLAFAQTISKLSDGAFDATCGNLTHLWRKSRDTGKLPTSNELKSAMSVTGYRLILLNEHSQQVRLKKPGMSIDLGGIAKGYAGQRAADQAAKNGVKLLIWAGGDIVATAPPSGERGWKVAIAGVNRSPIYLANAALSTSGDLEQNVEIDGRRYSHIVDVKTGLGIQSRIQATVLSRSGFISDPLAKVCCLLPKEKAEAIARRYGAELILVTPKD